MILLVYGRETGAWLASFAGLGMFAGLAVTFGRWPLLLVLLVVATAIIYFAGARRRATLALARRRGRRYGRRMDFSPGCRFPTMCAIYVRHLSTYDVTYGGISAAVALLLWFYLTGLILLVGAEINATLEQAAAQGKDRGARRYPDRRAK